MKMVSLLKGLDGLLGRRLCEAMPQARPATLGRPPCRFLIIRPGGMGDALLLAPMVRLLTETWPRSRVSIVAERRNAAAFDLYPMKVEIHDYQRPASLAAALGRHYDVVIDTEQWYYLSAIVARLARATVRIGFASNGRQRLFTHRVPYDQECYEACQFLRLLAPLGVSYPEAIEVPFLTVPPSATSRAAELLDGVGEYVVIFAGTTVAERSWGQERFSLLARRLADQGLTVVAVGGEDQRLAANAIVAGGVGINLAGRLTLAESAAVLAGGRLLVSNDSGVLHLAAGLGRPTVSLFGPTSRDKWGPRGSRHAILSHQPSCAPCTSFGHTPPCPQGAPCMAAITVEEVLTEVMGRLA
jgi:ADP-heptose:LPS heptosyltransferase